MEFRKKPVVIDAITFDQLVQHGRDNGANIVGGMPWSFSYKGHPISHENDRRYLIPTKEGTMNFTPDDMLITGVQGEIYPCKLDIFAATYDAVTQPGSDAAIEQEIIAKGKTAPRLRPSDIESSIAETHFFTAADGVRGAAVVDGVDDGSTPLLDQVTFCTLVLRNGARVVGINYGSISPENFGADLAQKLAHAAAVEKIWELEGYLLRDQLYRSALSNAEPKVGYAMPQYPG